MVDGISLLVKTDVTNDISNKKKNNNNNYKTKIVFSLNHAV